MNNEDLQQKQTKLIKRYFQADSSKFIYFYLPVPKQIQTVLELNDKDQSYKQFTLLYQQIAQFKQLKIMHHYQTIIQTLKSICVFGGLRFKGKKVQKDLNEICLKLTHIKNITFINLKMLDFQNCLLDNIQALSWLDMKNIQAINLSCNKITNLQSIVKTSFNNLKILQLHCNQFTYLTLKSFQRFYSLQISKMVILARKWMFIRYQNF